MHLQSQNKSMKYFGIDLGNYDTKSQNTTMPSGYEGPYASKPMMVNHFLEFNGKYYAPTIERLYYQQDKTKDERGIVLTLISIAKEMIYKYGKNNANHDEIQKGIDTVREIGLGVGLPISHYKKAYVDRLKEYYMTYMKEPITFTYDDYTFQFKVCGIGVYPQGGAAAMCKANKLAETYKTYYTVDIGGYTVDVSLFKNGQPCKDNFSLEMGIITLYDAIIDKVFKEFDSHLDYDVIESVLKEEQTILSLDIINLIKEMSAKHANNIINALRQQKIMFDSHPCLFVGGGSIQLMPYIIKNPLIKKETCLFIKDAKANAKGYARLIKAEMEG